MATPGYYKQLEYLRGYRGGLINIRSDEVSTVTEKDIDKKLPAALKLFRLINATLGPILDVRDAPKAKRFQLESTSSLFYKCTERRKDGP